MFLQKYFVCTKWWLHIRRFSRLPSSAGMGAVPDTGHCPRGLGQGPWHGDRPQQPPAGSFLLAVQHLGSHGGPQQAGSSDNRVTRRRRETHRGWSFRHGFPHPQKFQQRQSAFKAENGSQRSKVFDGGVVVLLRMRGNHGSGWFFGVWWEGRFQSSAIL